MALYFEFQSPPSVRKATITVAEIGLAMTISIPAFREEGDVDLSKFKDSETRFQSPPSVRKATLEAVGKALDLNISIPAFREEGDPVPQ